MKKGALLKKMRRAVLRLFPEMLRFREGNGVMLHKTLDSRRSRKHGRSPGFTGKGRIVLPPAEQYIEYRWNKGFFTCDKKKFDLIEPDGFEECWQCPASMGTGSFRRIRIGTGFDIWVTDCRFSRNAFIRFYDTPPSIFFGIYLSGKYAAYLKNGHSPINMERFDRQQYVMHINEPNGYGEIRTDEPLCHISIMISPEWLASYFEDDMTLLPPVMRRIAENKHVDDFMVGGDITTDAHTALRQILNCPLQGAGRKLFLEGRALEFMGTQLTRITDEPKPSPVFSDMHPNDRERIIFARDFLLRHLDNPPSLMNLAKTAGMSHPKLNRCFRQMYGMTVFQCLRDERLTRARNMLEDQCLTVTEAAFAVGYDSISHFSQAYKKHFGISPGRGARRGIMQERI